jgi:hypothetical protein
MYSRFFWTAVVLAFAASSPADDNLLDNGGFEQGRSGWRDLWSRTGEGRDTLDEQRKHAGRQAIRIEHSGPKDWSFQRDETLDVKPGQIYEFSGWVRVEGEGTATLGVILRGSEDRVLDWAYGGRTARAADDWQRLVCRFVIPPQGRQIVPRLIGDGPATVWLDDVSLVSAGDIAEMRSGNLPPSLSLTGESLQMTFDTATAALAVTDRRTGRSWRQHATTDMIIVAAEARDRQIDFRWLHTKTMLVGTGNIVLHESAPEIVVELSSEGEFDDRIAFPPPFRSEPGMNLILPVNEGISYPVDDPSLRPMHYHLYGGHGLCMGWYGVTAGYEGLLVVVETPDDASVSVSRVDNHLVLAPQWQSQKGHFGSPRRLKYVFFDDGGYVAMCKHYRHLRQQLGLVKTLAEKRQENPQVDLLLGAVNIWCWDRDPVAICRELKEAGIDRILWSNRGTPESIGTLNEMGVLTSRYDIYQDAMNPENFPRLRGIHGDWTSDAWPHDLAVDARGGWIRGWRVKGKDDQWYPCGVLCDRQAVGYARRRIPPELKTHPYRCRFIDTTTAAPWRECYAEDHPMTRSQSRHWKMELLRLVSEECGLVCGSETGHEAAVPYVHYFEGMLSLGPYRIPDSGRRMAEIWDEVPERVAKFQTGHFYRLPLWELVYHDCVIAQWYWGDYNNKLPKLWDRRDLWNALYGTPPMFMFNRQLWQTNRDRFVRSYRTAADAARATAYAEMLSHRWLTDDRAVQQTEFANGVTVTVNFGEGAFSMPDGSALGALECRVDGE